MYAGNVRAIWRCLRYKSSQGEMVKFVAQVQPGLPVRMQPTHEVSLWVYICDMDSQSGGMTAMTLQAVGGRKL